MLLAVDHASAASHGKTHDRTVPLVALDLVLAFHLRHEFVEEEILIVPAWYVEVSVLHLVYVPVSGIRHHDNHGTCLAA